ncbi:MBL fold metallo-hydrolase [Roseovarius sp. M141]|uniref:MBL fold metallo-hydrolase n=1 Tax=Roseovarius sp. M141 TaxID=2583806 RepID=UPI0020CB8016|nr:MBL fold metallo-hydrolase [Roseovarius sp. M141]MCQ0092930.1 MBL fold metallo-hydrolase [Roseovarius sp. M141]
MNSGALPPGVPMTLAPGLRRILAPNPSAMTLHGTNTYLIGTKGLAVVDPGPDDPAHLAAILSATSPGQRISHILVTHAHLDHSPLARRLAARTGAPVLAYGDAAAGCSAIMRELAANAPQGSTIGGGEGVDLQFAPDICLADGAVLEGDDWRIEALWTPGHFGNHMCFAWRNTILTGDLVMGWATSLVSPPDGDMSDYMASCRRLATRRPRILYPGHGAPVRSPAVRIDAILTHRIAREAAIIEALRHGPADAATLAAGLYTETPAALLPAATRNVLGHLIDLTCQNRVAPCGTLHAETVFQRQNG